MEDKNIIKELEKHFPNKILKSTTIDDSCGSADFIISGKGMNRKEVHVNINGGVVEFMIVDAWGRND